MCVVSIMCVIGKLTYQLSSEIMCMSSRRLSMLQLQAGLVSNIYSQLLVADIQPGSNVFTDVYDVELEYTATNVLDSWRGESIQQLLDIWIVILENPLLLLHPQQLLPHDGLSGGVIGAEMKGQLKSLCGYIFRNLYTCVLFAALAQCSNPDDEEEEEEEEEERIYEMHLEQLIMNICVVGRYHYKEGLGVLVRELGLMAAVCNQCGNNSSTQVYVPFIREILRVTVLFSTHLCTHVPLTSEEQEGAADSNNTTARSANGLPDALIYRRTVVYNEEHSVPLTILDSVLEEREAGHAGTNNSNSNTSAGAGAPTGGSVSPGILQLHGELVTQVFVQLLSQQCGYIQSQAQAPGSVPGDGSRSPAAALFSPVILQGIYSFYQHYLCVYMCDSSSSSGSGSGSGGGGDGPGAVLSRIHQSQAYALNTVIEGLLHCFRLLLIAHPQESDLLGAANQWLNNCIRIPALVQGIRASSSYRPLVDVCISHTVENAAVLHKLPMLTLVTFMECIGNTVIKVQPTDFALLCQRVYQQIEVCYNTVIAGAASRSWKPSQLKEVLHIIVLLLGIVR